MTMSMVGTAVLTCASVAAPAQTGTSRPGTVSTQTVAGLPAPDPAAVDALVASINRTLDGLAPAATIPDIEAALVFMLDQSQQPPAVVIAALDTVDLRKRPRKVRIAVANVRKARLAGTGALLEANDAALAAGPSSRGGGGTDYSTPN